MSIRSIQEDLGAKNHNEIERRWLLTNLENLKIPDNAIEVEYEHGFLPGNLIRERVTKRFVDPKYAKRITPYKRTVKIGEGEVRQEFEEPITEELFNTLWPITLNRRLRAIRWVVEDSELSEQLGTEVEWEVTTILEASFYTFPRVPVKLMPPFKMVEIELPAAGTAVCFPPWLASSVLCEITTDRLYEAWHLATGQ